jgi:peptidoglycan/LPS O-acetylase OafA/YrhL
MPCLDYLFLGIFAILFATGTGIELYWITTQNWPDDFFTILLCCALTGLGALFLFFRELIAEPKTWRNHVMLVLWGVTLALPIVTVWSGNSYISSCIERAGPGTTLKACNLSGADLHSKCEFEQYQPSTRKLDHGKSYKRIFNRCRFNKCYYAKCNT